MLLATFKHISSKNADYSAAEAYLTFEHDEFTMKPTLDENGRLIPRQDYRISTLNCGDEDFAIACLRANLRYRKNQKREDVKSHHYIISLTLKMFPTTVDRRSDTEPWREILQGTLSRSSSRRLYTPRRTQRQRQCSCTHRYQFSAN